MIAVDGTTAADSEPGGDITACIRELLDGEKLTFNSQIEADLAWVNDDRLRCGVVSKVGSSVAGTVGLCLKRAHATPPEERAAAMAAARELSPHLEDFLRQIPQGFLRAVVMVRLACCGNLCRRQPLPVLTP